MSDRASGDERAAEDERAARQDDGGDRPDHGAGNTGERRAGTPGDRLEALLSEHSDEPQEPESTEEAGSTDPYDPFALRSEPEQGTDGDEGDEGDDLPDAPLFALLRTMAEQITSPRIDRVWIFPPRRIEAGETSVVVVASFTETDDDKRRVYAAHYTALDDSDEHRLAVDEYGTAPAERVGRLVEEVVERIKDGPAGAPRSVRIEGSERRWDETLHELAEEHLEDRQRDRRLR